MATLNYASKPPAADELEMPRLLRQHYQRRAIYGNLLSPTVAYIVVGLLMTYYATQVLNLSGTQMARIGALIQLNQLFRFLLLPLTRRYTRIQVLVVVSVIRLLTLGAVLAIPAASMTFPRYLGLIVVFTYSQSLADVFWQPLLRDITTVEDRGSFFARMRFWFQVATSGSPLLVGVMLGGKITETQYKWALVLAMAGIANFLFWGFRLPDRREATGDGASLKESWRYLCHVARHSQLLRRPLLISVLLTLAGIPMATVYSVKLLHVPLNVSSLVTGCSIVASAAGFLLWGRIADRVGPRPMVAGLLLLTTFLVPLQFLVAPFGTGEFSWGHPPPRELFTIIVMFVQAVMGAILLSGSGIGMITLQHFCVRREEAMEAMNLFALITALCASLTTLFTGYLLDHVVVPYGDKPLLGGWLHVDGFKLYAVLMVFLLRLPAIRLCSKLPNTRPECRTRDFFLCLVPSFLRPLPPQPTLAELTKGKNPRP